MRNRNSWVADGAVLVRMTRMVGRASYSRVTESQGLPGTVWDYPRCWRDLGGSRLVLLRAVLRSREMHGSVRYLPAVSLNCYSRWCRTPRYWRWAFASGSLIDRSMQLLKLAIDTSLQPSLQSRVFGRPVMAIKQFCAQLVSGVSSRYLGLTYDLFPTRCLHL